MQTIDKSLISMPDSIQATLEEGETVAIRTTSGIIAFIVPVSPKGHLRPCALAKGEFTVPDDFNKPDPEIEAMFCGQG